MARSKFRSPNQVMEALIDATKSGVVSIEQLVMIVSNVAQHDSIDVLDNLKSWGLSDHPDDRAQAKVIAQRCKTVHRVLEKALKEF